MNTTYLKSIQELLDLNFFIPSYQRGYRWDKTQVVELLEDIWEFNNISAKAEGEFYCLQPIIVKNNSGKYQLIDGQQRLTTIYIILSYFGDVAKLLFGEDKKFSIEYETRKDSKVFLENINNITDKNLHNIDYYHMSQAYLTIENWFTEHSKRKVDFLNTLLKENRNKDNKDIANNVRIIWYEIDENESEIEVFTRINSGKIPLTNAELIKALFLNSKNFKDNEKNIKQIEISKEWDEMEYALQNDEFWYFLTRNKRYSTRIELIFEIFANKESVDRYDTYRFFAQEAKNGDIVQLWSESTESIKKVFLSLKYWFDNRKLYHLIGFLISEEIEDVRSIYQNFKETTKSQFQKDLYMKIIDFIKYDNIDELEYETKRLDIKRILLLFNIATILNSKDSYVRFSFDKFNNENWSLEHIHAQQEKNLSSNEAKKTWLEETRKYIKCMGDKDKDSISLLKKVDDSISSNRFENFETLQTDIFGLFGMTEIHTIDNLALLPKSINSSLGNNIFPAKRAIITKKDKQGEFIPICTKNVFLKFYSQDIHKLYLWDKDDRRDYLKEIKKVLNDFIGATND